MSERRADVALLIVDVQNMVVDWFPGAAATLEPLRRAVAHARSEGVPVIFVGARFRPQHPEVGPNNLLFAQLKDNGLLVVGSDGAEFHPDVAPSDGDLVVDKRRIGAFSGTDLEALLRPMGIRRLVVGGLVTSGAVLSTVRAAADLDYGVTVLSDACADFDDQVHRVLTSTVLPMTADVVTVEEWTGNRSATGAGVT